MTTTIAMSFKSQLYMQKCQNKININRITSYNAKQRLCSLPRRQCITVQASRNNATEQASTFLHNCGKAAAALSAAILLSTATPAYAEIETVTADQATQMAKPLKQQPVNKERIWMLLILGASSLFGVTIILENNESWFPAISRANRAMKQSAKIATQQPLPPMPPREPAPLPIQGEGLDEAVLAGLASASARFQAETAAASQTIETQQQDDDDENEESESTTSTASDSNNNSSDPIEVAAAEDRDGEDVVEAGSGTGLEDVDLDQLERELQRRKGGTAVGQDY